MIKFKWKRLVGRKIQAMHGKRDRKSSIAKKLMTMAGSILAGCSGAADLVTLHRFSDKVMALSARHPLYEE